MPIITFIAGGVSLVAGHKLKKKAKEKNERAAYQMEKAQQLYDNEKAELEKAKSDGYNALSRLGNLKNNILHSSMDQFLKSYEKLKHVEFIDRNTSELSRFTIQQNDVLEIQELKNIYQSSFKKGTLAAAAAAPLALTASGVVAPIAILAAPVSVVTGISANRKANQNLERAETAYKQAQAAVAEMQVSETLCRGIQRNAEMYIDLLQDLNRMFRECTQLFAGVIRARTSSVKRHVDAEELTREELALAAVTRSLAGAIKAAIDVSLLDDQSHVTEESTKTYNTTVQQLPVFSTKVQEVQSFQLAGSVAIQPIPEADTEYRPPAATFKDILRTIAGILVGLSLGIPLGFFIGRAIDDAYYLLYPVDQLAIPYQMMLFSSFFALCIMENRIKAQFPKTVKNVACLLMGTGFLGMFYLTAPLLSKMSWFFLVDLILGALLFFGTLFVLDNKKNRSWQHALGRFLSCLFLFCVALLLFHIMNAWLHIPKVVALILSEIIYLPGALIGCFISELMDQ